MSTRSSKARGRKQTVVIEIGNNWIKMIQFNRSRNGQTATKIHVETFDTPGAGVARSLAQAVRKHRLADRPVIACLSRQMVNIRMLDLPSTEPNEIADMVDLQAGKQTPYSKDEILCDHRMIGAAREGYTRVMLVIVQRSLLRQQYTLLREAGLEVERMTVSSEGIVNWARHALPGKPGSDLLLDLDAGYTDAAVFSEGRLAFTRSIMVGAEALGADRDSARERFVKEIRRSLDMFAAGGGGNASPVRVTLSGARVPRLAEELGEALDMEVRVVDTFDGAACAPGEGAQKRTTASVTALVGIGLDPDRLEFDLIPDVARMRKELHAKSRRLATFVTLIMAVMLSASLVASIKYFMQRSRLLELRREFESTLPVVARTERMQELIKVARERADRDLSPLNLLAEIHGVVDGDLYFDVINIDRAGGRIALSGSAGTARDIRTLVNNLQDSERFETVRETGTTAKDQRTGRYKFEVVCELER